MCRHSGNGNPCGRVRCGLAAIPGYLGGVFVSFGSANTPLDEGRTRRFKAGGLVEDNSLFQPLAGLPTITNPTREREASPTGKRDGGRMYARLPSQNFDGGDARALLTLTATGTPAGARTITRAQIDPWKSTVGKTSWTPGAMAQERVSG